MTGTKEYRQIERKQKKKDHSRSFKHRPSKKRRNRMKDIVRAMKLKGWL